MSNDTAFEMATSNLRFGPGVTREVGMDIVDMGARRVLVLTDPKLSGLPPVAIVRESLDARDLEVSVSHILCLGTNAKISCGLIHRLL